MPSDREYHTIVRGRQRGPLSRAEMVDLASRGEIGPDTLAWTDGMTVWRPLPEVPGLNDLLADVAGPVPQAPTSANPDTLLPASVESALDDISRSQAFVIGALIFYGLIAVLGIGTIFSFRRLALLGFWGSAALAFMAYRTWRQEQDGRPDEAVRTAFAGAVGSWVLAAISLVFGNFFFAALQAGAGLLFWLGRVELVTRQPASVGGDRSAAAEATPPTTDGPAEPVRKAPDPATSEPEDEPEPPSDT